MPSYSPAQARQEFRTTLLIDNVDQRGQGSAVAVINPATEEPVVQFPAASLAQVNEAVDAAKRAFECAGEWQDPAYRRLALSRFADEIERNQDRLMETLIEEIGTPVSLKSVHINTCINLLRWSANAAVVDRTRHLGLNAGATGLGTILYRPVGVVAAISAFNYPLFLATAKIGAALAAGCTTVLLSSPQAPLGVFLLGDLIRKAGFPQGVVNIIAGGAEIGRALTENPGVDKVTFTGSVDVGRKVMQQAASGLKSVVLELGGKSAAIMLPKVDFKKYAFSLHARYARHAGQGCGSPTRILIEECRFDEFVQISRDVYPQLKVGDPRDPSTVLGPVISSAQRDRIEQTVNRAIADGAKIIAGGGRPDRKKGWFLNPVLLGCLDNQASIARSEIFGPVCVVLTYRTVEEAVAIANDSELGLKAYVFGSRKECLELVPKLRVGTIQINGGSPNRPDGAIVGYKKSGVGAEWGEDGLREFLRPQYIDIALD